MSEGDYGHSADCPHDKVTQLELIGYEYPSIHSPCTEIWRVRCEDCGGTFEEQFIGD